MSEAPAYDRAFLGRLVISHRLLTGHELVPPTVAVEDALRWLYDDAPFALLAHDAASDPRFLYANRFAQRCFERDWCELVGMPSRLSAEPAAQPERAAALAQVATRGYATDYRGIRIAKSGRRFWIEQGTLWNVLSADGTRIGQAATFRQTTPCTPGGALT